MISISEMIPNFDEKLPIKEVFQELIKAIHEKAKETDNIFAVLVDEMPPSFFESCPEYQEFFQNLQENYPLVHVFMAISPSGRNLTKPIII